MKILIAEDQANLGRLFAELVGAWGYEAVIAQDGLEALAELQKGEAPRLALLDWLMPGLDGIEVCRRLRQEADRAYPYLILMTGQGGRQEMLEGLAAGPDDLPVNP